MFQTQITRLREKQRQYCGTEQFHVGDLVVWKDGMDNRQAPRPNQPAIVTKVYPAPIYSNEERGAGHPLFREPLDIVVGFLDSDGDLIELHADSHRMCTAPASDFRPKDVAKLREMGEQFAAPHTFAPGDVVTWKRGFQNKKRPAASQPAVVIEVLEHPIIDPVDESAGNPYFREPLDVKLAIIDEDGEMLIYHFDSRRFELLN